MQLRLVLILATLWRVYPVLKTVEQGPVFLLRWVDPLLLSDVVVLQEMGVQVRLQGFVPDEPQAAVGTLEFDAVEQLVDRQIIVPENR